MPYIIYRILLVWAYVKVTYGVYLERVAVFASSHTHSQLDTKCFKTSANLNTEQFLKTCVIDQAIVDYTNVVYGASVGLNVLEIAQRSDYWDRIRVKVSYALNDCTNGTTSEHKEVLLQHAIAIYPWNALAMRNLALMHESYGVPSVALSLYEQCIELTGDKGSRLHAALVAPGLLWNEQQARSVYLRIARSLLSIIDAENHKHNISHFPAPIAPYDDTAHFDAFINSPLTLMNAMPPVNMQYLGHNGGVVSELTGLAVRALFPELSVNLVQPASGATQRNKQKVIRLGVVSEFNGNSSPGLCLTDVLSHLVTSSQQADSSIDHANSTHIPIELVFFDRPGLHTVFAETMRALAVQTVMLRRDDLNLSRQLVADAQVDVLMYIALPTEKLSYFLAYARLAPVQVQFGAGHPISSGIPNIDFSVLPLHMLSARGNFAELTAACSVLAVGAHTDNDGGNAHSEANVVTLVKDALKCMGEHSGVLGTGDIATDGNNDNGDHMMQRLCDRGQSRHLLSNSVLHYSEQVVVFESLSYFLQDPIDLYRGDPAAVAALQQYSQYRAPLSAYDNVQSSTLSCSDINAKLVAWQIYPNITAEGIGCRQFRDAVNGSSNSINTVVFARQYHLYNAMHIGKKLHPRFDGALLGILRADRSARIIALQSMRDVFPRLLSKLQQYDLSESDIVQRIVLAPRMPHIEYLQLLALSSVFLNPFPFGAGVTSSEALAMTVPLVLLPAETAVLHFASAQVHALGQDLARIMITKSVEDYVQRAVDIAHGRVIHLHSLRELIRSRKSRLFGDDNLNKVVSEWRTFIDAVTLVL